MACIISFRSLWGQRVQQGVERDRRRRRSPPRAGLRRGLSLRQRLKRFHDDALDTFKDMEGTTLERNDVEMLSLPQPPSGHLSVNFTALRTNTTTLAPATSNVWDSSARTPVETWATASVNRTQTDTPTIMTPTIMAPTLMRPDSPQPVSPVSSIAPSSLDQRREARSEHMEPPDSREEARNDGFEVWRVSMPPRSVVEAQAQGRI
jgi:hypothetical protein